MLPEVEVLELNHDVDYVHMLLSIPPKMRVSDVVRTFKSHTGRLMKKKFEYMRKAYWGADGIWFDGSLAQWASMNVLLSAILRTREKKILDKRSLT